MNTKPLLDYIRKYISLTEEEATLMAMAIHEDTGSFTFDTTTPRDLEALAWLLRQGAQDSHPILAKSPFYGGVSANPYLPDRLARSGPGSNPVPGEFVGMPPTFPFLGDDDIPANFTYSRMLVTAAPTWTFTRM